MQKPNDDAKSDVPKMLDRAVSDLRQMGLLRPIDTHFAILMGNMAGTSDTRLQLAAALVSRAVGNGHVCLDINRLAQTGLLPDTDPPHPLTFPTPSEWITHLKSTQVVGQPGDYCPMILDAHGRLYLQRYWAYESYLAEFIKNRSNNGFNTTDIDTERLMRIIRRLFPENKDEATDGQKEAALTAVLNRFCVITGGPGTGKTYTLVKILAILAELTQLGEWQVKLATPTGKAANRLSQSIKHVKTYLNCATDIKQRIPEETHTIHRLLRYDHRRGDFFYSSRNKLPLKTLIIDEASMVDLALMSRLVQALPDDARLVLAGDHNQLASVEAGSVLGDICNQGRKIIDSHSIQPRSARMEHGVSGSDFSSHKGQAPLRPFIVSLTHNYRFSEKGRIGKLSDAVNSGEPQKVFSILHSREKTRVKWCPVSSAEELYRQLQPVILEGYAEFIKADDPGIALAAFHRFQVLSPLNKGPYGVMALNLLAEQTLDRAKLIHRRIDGTSEWYAGRPVMITANDYTQGLFNGDIGVTVKSEPPNESGYTVVFAEPHGRLKKIPLFRLPEHETVYAMTVHKSQGSEFDTVHLVLPDKENRILTRELLYTAITRSRSRVWIWGTETVLTAALTRKIERSSGLRDALWPGEPFKE